MCFLIKSDKMCSMNAIIEQLRKEENCRENLSKLRELVKTNERKAQCIQVEGYAELFAHFLDSEDAKTRKNAALLLGDLACQNQMNTLLAHYQNETTEFVKGAYLEALAKLDVTEILDQLMKLLEQLSDTEITVENRKHMEAQMRPLRSIQLKYQGKKVHRMVPHPKGKVILTCNREVREVLRRSITSGRATAHPLGVLVECEDLHQITANRLYRELLFPVSVKGLLEPDPDVVAEALWNADILGQLLELHGEEGPFSFRIELKSSMGLDKKSIFTKRMAGALERMSKGQLLNSTTDYEVELRLVANKEGKLYPCMKLKTVPQHRFYYRKNSIAASIHPATAAVIMELAQPYMKEHAQIMDPFCGVGTMLIERHKKLSARQIYGTDIYGEAIEKARENAALAGVNINYIHRDFFDFKHEYLFDEMITNMPIRGKKTKEEMDTFYGQFFDKVSQHMAPGGVIIMYTNEEGFVKKQLRLHENMKLLDQYLMQEKNGFYLMIMEIRG